MTYDNYGNILTKNGKVYTYGDEVWKDKLTAIGDETITYDAQGNPTSYLGHTLTWEKGRQLKSFDGNTYTYNANGIRTSKTVNGVKHTYTLDGTKILREVWDDKELIPLYDNEDSVCGLYYGGMGYYFLKNLQGDVIAITDEYGKTVAKYAYDAWGKCTIVEDTSNCNIATLNPYRYRGYYYDPEIEMYYLQSRYYDPVVGRWLTYDALIHQGRFDKGAGLLATNLLAYCANNPTNYLDISGESITAILIGVGIGLLVGGLAGWGYARYFKIPKDQSWKYILGGALIGACIGGCAGYALSAGSGAVLWSGKGMGKAAASFARKNGLRVLGQTSKGMLLRILNCFLPKKLMNELWSAASMRFLLSYAGKQSFVHIFITAEAYRNMASIFNRIEIQVIAELGLKIIWHFYK